MTAVGVAAAVTLAVLFIAMTMLWRIPSRGDTRPSPQRKPVGPATDRNASSTRRDTPGFPADLRNRPYDQDAS